MINERELVHLQSEGWDQMGEERRAVTREQERVGRDADGSDEIIWRGVLVLPLLFP